MAMRFLNIGYGNIVSAHRIIAIVSPESAPIKRTVQEAQPETIAHRLNNKEDLSEEG